MDVKHVKLGIYGVILSGPGQVYVSEARSSPS